MAFQCHVALTMPRVTHKDLPNGIPPVLHLCYQQKCGKCEFLSLSTLYYPEDLLTFPQPHICFIWGGLASELHRLMTHEILHCHWSDWWDHRPRLRCNRVHRVHHPMDRIRNLIRPSIISASPISHCLCTPHNSAVHINQLRL